MSTRISQDLASLSYACIDDVVECIKLLSIGTLLTKMDLENVYRHIPIHPVDQYLFGISCTNMTYITGLCHSAQDFL